MNDTMQLITIFVGVVGGMKALEWVLKLLFGQHDKVHQIDTNKDEFAKYKEESEQRFQKIETSMVDAHNSATENLNEIRTDIMSILNEQGKAIAKDKEDYLTGINEVKASISEMSSLYQQTVSIIEVKIDNLEKKQDLHNSVITRTYELEKQVGILDNREAVSEHRISDLERKV